MDDPAPIDEFLREYEDLVVFGLKAGTLSEDSARRLRRTARDRPEEAQAVLARAREKGALIEDVKKERYVARRRARRAASSSG